MTPVAEDVCRTHRLSVAREGRTVVHEVSLAVPRGTVVAVVGGDGAGKTTLLRTLAGRLPPASGTAALAGPAGVMPATGAVFSDLTVAENLAFVRAAHHLDHDEQQALLERMGLRHAVDRLAQDLSGGMRQKLGLAMALQHRPAVLLLDEPTTGVDPVSRSEIWTLLREEAAEGTAVVLATTYLDEAARADRVLVLDEGHVVGQGTPAEVCAATPGVVLSRPRTDPDVAGRSWRRGATWRTWLPDGDPDHPDAITVDLEDAVVVAALRRRAADGRDGAIPAAVTDGATPADPDAAPVVRAIDVTRRFGTATATDAVSLAVAPGEVVGLLGANGAGKTTLIRMLLGLLPPTEGTIDLLGAPPTVRANRRRIGYVPQGSGLYTDLTVRQNQDFHRRVFGDGPAGGDTPPDDDPADDRLVEDLPLGEQRRLAFDVASAHSPDLLVLDEPTSGVGPLGRAALWESILRAAQAGAGVRVTTHHMAEAEQCDRLVVMAAGRVVASGTARSIADGHDDLEAAVVALTAATAVGR